MALGSVASVILGVAFLAAGGGKLASKAWPRQARELGAPSWAIPVLPWAELALGALLVMQIGRVVVASLAAALLAAFTALLVVRLAQGRHPPCACFGGRSARPIDGWSLVRNVVLIALAIVAALG
jgi:Methylamine utilisation protein MauE